MQSTLEEMERWRAKCEQKCADNSGRGEVYSMWRQRLADVLCSIAEYRPLSVFELMQSGHDYPGAVFWATATGGERTDLQELRR